ncbi:MAG: IS200/IS605 family element RNA-guided endonuclease TnpB [Olsenella sp.]|nr:IS200/IS605 family element RNA-guided endonuclease TnpB [Atopobiaceae bacterium]
MERSYEMRIYPNARQRELIGRTFGCCRWVYNKCLEERRAAYESTGKSPTRFQQDRMLPSWKAENPWLMEADSHALQQAVADLDRAYQNFFRRCRQGGRPGYPRFRSKRDARQSYRTSQGVSVPDARHVKLPKLGLVKARVSRGIEGRVLSATVKQVPSGRYFVCLCCTDCPEPEAAPGAIAVLGIDAGVHDLMVRSDGVKIASPRALARSERRLAREQRRLSRKRKGSASRRKQKRKVARIHERIADQRKDAIHKATTDAVRESQAIAVEDLDVRGMERDRRLAKAVADASMSEMLRQLEYKCSWHGRRFVKVSRWYPSSKTCSCCGHVLEELPLSVRAWTCPACGARHDRDFNAALNIAREGARLLDRADGTAGPAGTSGAKASGTLLEQA